MFLEGGTDAQTAVRSVSLQTGIGDLEKIYVHAVSRKGINLSNQIPQACLG
jgi:hypothetical protein